MTGHVTFATDLRRPSVDGGERPVGVEHEEVDHRSMEPCAHLTDRVRVGDHHTGDTTEPLRDALLGLGDGHVDRSVVISLTVAGIEHFVEERIFQTVPR